MVLSPEESWLPIASIIFGIVHVQVKHSQSLFFTWVYNGFQFIFLMSGKFTCTGNPTCEISKEALRLWSLINQVFIHTLSIAISICSWKLASETEIFSNFSYLAKLRRCFHHWGKRKILIARIMMDYLRRYTNSWRIWNVDRA